MLAWRNWVTGTSATWGTEERAEQCLREIEASDAAWNEIRDKGCKVRRFNLKVRAV
jgi:hypothetical protein